jgi:hypothetical protein
VIRVLGVNQGQEYEAALHLKKKLVSLWPDLIQSKTDIVRIYVGLKMYGQDVEDLDLVVLCHFEDGREFDSEFKFYSRGAEPYVPRSSKVHNLALVIEVKSHDQSGVKFVDKVASVRYPSGWECVTEKNRKQVFEFKKYLARNSMPDVFVQDLIYFSSLRERDLPERPHNCFGVDSGFERILSILGQVSSPLVQSRHAKINFGSDADFDEILGRDSTFLRELEASPLDRKRMDLIVKQEIGEEWISDISERQVLLRGRGGVGKTVVLLQMAFLAYQRRALRSVVLTYNKALVADMRRTMALLGVPRSLVNGGIHINTVHAFIGRILVGLGVVDGLEDFIESYEEHKETLLKYLKSGAITDEDIASLIHDNGYDLAWDLVFVDEGQDWPQNEIAILRSVYSMTTLVVADGVDQFVRSSRADWDHGLAVSQRKPRYLTKCLRMKSNITSFVSDCAKEFGLDDWDLEPNTDASGGQVVVVEGDLVGNPSLLLEYFERAAELGNSPIDLLTCVPPSLVNRSADGAHCVLKGDLESTLGVHVWDGTSEAVRSTYPTSRDQLRVVQYESCRGLEGWIVANYLLDELFETKLRRVENSASGQALDSPDQVEDERIYAAQWLMIPMTRAIDTLILNVSSRESKVKDVLRTVYRRRRDFMTWITNDDSDQ